MSYFNRIMRKKIFYLEDRINPLSYNCNLSLTGFTLIELLVVLVIVGLLAAFLASVLGKAREEAKRAQCANNLRQHGIAWYLYLDEHNECFPEYQLSPKEGGCPDAYHFGGKLGTAAYGDPDFGAQYRVLNRYLDIYDEYSSNIEAFHCPDDRKPVVGATPEDTIFGYYGNSYVANIAVLEFEPEGLGEGFVPRPLATITRPFDKLYMETCHPSVIPGHGGRGMIFGRTPVMVLFFRRAYIRAIFIRRGI